MEQQTPIPPPPQIKDEAKTRHFPILDLWGRGVQFPIYFVQDCSYFDFFTYFPISSKGSPASLRATPLVVRRRCRSSRYALKYKSTTIICPLRLLSSVGRAPVCWAGVRGFKPRLGQHSGDVYTQANTQGLYITEKKVYQKHVWRQNHNDKPVKVHWIFSRPGSVKSWGPNFKLSSTVLKNSKLIWSLRQEER